jgi:hypothetical protein
MHNYDDPIKDVAWRTFWEGYKHGRDTESYKDITRRTAREQFERWWARNV